MTAQGRAMLKNVVQHRANRLRTLDGAYAVL
jgi:hypothetical protein